MRNRRSTSPAFTLIELLVAVSLIAVLIALLMPAMKRARDAAKAVVCASNMSQSGIALVAYAGDHRRLLPPSKFSDGSNWSWGWCLFKNRYVLQPNAMACPTAVTIGSGGVGLGPEGDLGVWNPAKSISTGDNVRQVNVFGMRQGSTTGTGHTVSLSLSNAKMGGNFFWLTEVLRSTLPHVDFHVADRYHLVYLKHFDRATTLYADGSVRATEAAYFLTQIDWGQPLEDALLYGRTTTVRDYDTR